MRTQRDRTRRRVFLVEGLEVRQLLTTTIGGTTPSVVVIRRSLKDLQTQLTNGALADLNSGAVDGNGFITEVQGVEASYEQSVDTKFLPHLKAIDELLKLQGQRIVADLVSLNQQSTVGMFDSNALALVSGGAINSLTAGPLYSINTPVSAIVSTTQVFETNLQALARTLNSSSSNPLSIADVSTTLQAEAEAYRADVHAALQLSHPFISGAIDGAVTILEAKVVAIAASISSTAQADVNKAIAAFDTAILGTSGLLSIPGPVNGVNKAEGFVRHNLSVERAATTLNNVSGTAIFGGTATLTATLTSGGKGVSGAVVSFTLDGAFAGTAVTGSDGVATLTGVPTSDAVGTATGAVVATFAGDRAHQSSSNSGDLVVSAAASSLSSVSGTASFGGTATLVATLTSSVTNQPLDGETVAFTLDGKSVGTATTSSSGVATLSGVATTDSVGTHTGAVVASFAGDSSFGAAKAAGNLVVSQAGTTLAANTATVPFGGMATLTATLTSAVTGQPVSGATVTFTLDGTSVGSATTNSSGLAILSNVATTDSVGTHTAAIVASFAGNTDFAAAANAAANLVVTQAATSLGSVSGSGTSGTGGRATLVATLTSQVTNKGISNQIVSFKLGTTSAGTALTDSHGVATLSNVPTTGFNPGVTPSAVTASFTGSTNFMAAADAHGDLTLT
jgi:hypothetical protein